MKRLLWKPRLWLLRLIAGRSTVLINLTVESGGVVIKAMDPQAFTFAWNVHGFMWGFFRDAKLGNDPKVGIRTLYTVEEPANL